MKAQPQQRGGSFFKYGCGYVCLEFRACSSLGSSWGLRFQILSDGRVCASWPSGRKRVYLFGSGLLIPCTSLFVEVILTTTQNVPIALQIACLNYLFIFLLPLLCLFIKKKKKWYLVTSIHLGMYFFFFDEMQWMIDFLWIPIYEYL